MRSPASPRSAATGGAGGSSGGGGGGATEPPAAEVGTGTGQSSAPPAASGQNELPAPPQQTPEQREKQHLENQDKKGEIGNKYLPPAQNKEVKQAIANELKKPSVKKRSLWDAASRVTLTRLSLGSRQWELFQKWRIQGVQSYGARIPDGKIKIKLDDEFDDNRFRVNVNGEVLSGYGVNAQIRGNNLDLVIPPDLYKTRNYYYVTLNATTGTFKTKASSSDEVTKKFTEEYKLTPELGYKDIIKVSRRGWLDVGEGGQEVGWPRDGDGSDVLRRRLHGSGHQLTLTGGLSIKQKNGTKGKPTVCLYIIGHAGGSSAPTPDEMGGSSTRPAV